VLPEHGPLLQSQLLVLLHVIGAAVRPPIEIQRICSRCSLLRSLKLRALLG
jgi:hypothetical protein